MTAKRPHHASDGEPRSAENSSAAAPAAKKPKYKGGFRVGPANLPDTQLQWKRKNQAIKRGLIEKAKLRKDYAKVKAHAADDVGAGAADARTARYYEEAAAAEAEEEATRRRQRLQGDKGADTEGGDDVVEGGDGEAGDGAEQGVGTAPHPDRQSLIDREAETPTAAGRERDGREEQAEWRGEKRQRRQKTVPFAREQRDATRRREEAESRRKEREEAERERQRKTEERERFRTAMAKARRGGRNGQRKLGRESGVLLERVRKMVEGT